jgi:DNA-binding FadR family transcriptional regulator
VTSSRAATLADEIEVEIVRGKIPQGERLGTKEDLQRRYNVAYGTLNETLRILQQRGYVASRTGPGGGLFAAVPTSSERLRRLLSNFPEGGTLRDCAEVRHSLEQAITLDAARHRTRKDIVDLLRILKSMESSTGEAAKYLHENWQLHRRIAQCCRNRVLASLYITLLDANEPGPGYVMPDRHRSADNAANYVAHVELVEAIASGVLDRARRAVEAHEAFFAPVDDAPVIPARATRKPARRRAATTS